MIGVKTYQCPKGEEANPKYRITKISCQNTFDQ